MLQVFQNKMYKKTEYAQCLLLPSRRLGVCAIVTLGRASKAEQQDARPSQGGACGESDRRCTLIEQRVLLRDLQCPVVALRGCTKCTFAMHESHVRVAHTDHEWEGAVLHIAVALHGKT